LNDDKEKLSASEERFRAFIEQSPLAICLTRGFSLLYANPKFYTLMGLSHDVHLPDIYIPDLFAPEHQEASKERIRRRVLGLPQPMEVETAVMRQDGTQFPVYLAASKLMLPEGEASIVFMIDITERKLAVEKLLTSLAEKEVLLRELYHRTRNNMNVIVAMLSLQADYEGDENLKAAFLAAQSRIQAMSLVHRKLYDSKNLSRLNLKDYIADLMGLLLMNETGMRDRVAIETRMDDVPVLIDTAIPCGLVLSEIISNSIKHAFPDGRSGTIIVDLSCAPDGTIKLIVADDGVGLPQGFDIRTSGKMGLNFIFLIGEGQLQAKIKTNVQRGVAFELVFKDDLYSARV